MFRHSSSEGSARVPRKVLIVDDDPSACALIQTSLQRRGFQVVSLTSPQEAASLLVREDLDAVVTDLNMRGMNGIELCERVAATRPELPVIVITAFGSIDTAVAAIRAGAYDFITKPFETDSLVMALDRAIAHHNLRQEVKRLREVVNHSQQFGSLLGSSPVMVELFQRLARVAESDVSVLITGESGTGKEVAARAVHDRSARRERAFVAINCAAMPEALLESELFGHVKGAFTDARTSRAGLFAQADGGTLFLDEIGDMPLPLQPKLLRVLQERRYRPVGGDNELPVDVRVIAATNRDIDTAVEERTFREDLYYRINVVRLEMPPLRARGADVLTLAQTFLERAATRSDKRPPGLSPAAAERLLAYAWPDNIRELQNCIECAVALTPFDQLSVDDLPEKIRSYRRSHVLVTSDDPAELVTLDEVDRRYVLRVLEATGGNKRQAARVLGLDRRTLYRKLERYGVPTTGLPSD